MMPEEKQKLLALFEHRNNWCREVEARDGDGEPVTYDDDAAAAWDITGALCHLFGWRRACVLFGQLERQLVGKRTTIDWPPRDEHIEAMKALQDFNDRTETTFDVLHAQLEAMPVWSGGSRADESATEA